MNASLDPVWGEVIDFTGVTLPLPPLVLRVYDWDRLGKNDYMGFVSIDISGMFHSFSCC